MSGSSYLVTRDQEGCPNKETRYSLSSGGHEEDWLLLCDHGGLGDHGGVGSLRGHSGRGSRGDADRRVIPQPLRQGDVSPPKLTHLYEETGWRRFHECRFYLCEMRHIQAYISINVGLIGL